MNKPNEEYGMFKCEFCGRGLYSKRMLEAHYSHNNSHRKIVERRVKINKLLKEDKS